MACGVKRGSSAPVPSRGLLHAPERTGQPSWLCGLNVLTGTCQHSPYGLSHIAVFKGRPGLVKDDRDLPGAGRERGVPLGRPYRVTVVNLTGNGLALPGETRYGNG